MGPFHFPLRFGIPLALLVFTLVLGGWSVFHEKRVRDRREEQAAAEELNRRLTSFQGTLDFLFSKGALEQVQQEMTNLQIDHALEYTVVTDESGTVLASGQREFVGQTPVELGNRFAQKHPGLNLAESILRARTRRRGEVRLSGDGNSLAGVYPVMLGVTPGQLGSSRIGVAIVLQDLRARKAAVRAEVWLGAAQFAAPLAGFTILLGLAAHLVVTRRMARLVSAAKQFSSGDWGARAGLTGRDEIGTMGSAFDAMAGSVAENQKRLKDNEQRLQMVLEGSNDGFWDWNVTTGVTEFSRRDAELLGCRPEDLEPHIRAWQGRIHPEDKPASMEALEKHLEGATPFYETEHRLRDSSGEWKWILARGKVVARDEHGKPLRMAGTHSDITERKRSEAELKEKLDIIQRQREAIRVLSTPIIKVWDDVLTVPVLGELDAGRAAEMMDSLLAALAETHCRYAILDLTGVESIDTATADHIMKIISSVELLGAKGLVVGIRPQVARALVSIGVDLSRLTTLGNLREALVLCMRRSPARGAVRPT